jgi:hypothetical protein
MSRVLVLNSGSSSVKYRLFDGSATTAKGLVERIGEPGGDAPDHRGARQQIMDRVEHTGLAAVGHRVVHGGPAFTEPTIVDDDVADDIEALIPLAPPHNPAALTGNLGDRLGAGRAVADLRCDFADRAALAQVLGRDGHGDADPIAELRLPGELEKPSPRSGSS